MEKMLTEICDYLNNYFWRTKRNGTIRIEDGTFVADYLQEGQYFRIVGSVFPENEGVHKYPATDLKDEIFEGSIWSMAVPQAVIDLASDVEAWKAKYGTVDSPAMSPYTSESFNNYSYSKNAGSSNADGSNSSNTWQGAFASRLNMWKRLRMLP